MSKLPLVLRELHRSEASLRRELVALADRHHTDHEIGHVARDLAGWSAHHMQELAVAGRRHGVQLRPQPRPSIPGLRAASRRLATALGRRPETGLLLLADLRRTHRKAAGVSLDWELLAQAAQALRHRDLLELAQKCHPETLRIMRWANAHLKATSPQIIAS